MCLRAVAFSRVLFLFQWYSLFFPFLLLLSLAKAFPFYFLKALSPVDCFVPLDETRKLDGTGGIEKFEKIFNFLRKSFSNVYHENLVAF